MKIKFIDTVSSPGKRLESSLSADQAAKLLYEQTGREVLFADGELSKFALVYAPAPIGFFLIANEDIPKDSKLFDYGGELLTSGSPDNEYLLNAKENIFFQAKKKGGMGSLLAHLPTREELDGFQISDTEEIQLANSAYYMEKGRAFFKSTVNIPKGTVIGFSYGIIYWMQRNATYNLFRSNSYETLNLNAIQFTPQVHIFDAATGNDLDWMRTSEKVVVGYSLLGLERKLLQMQAAAFFTPDRKLPTRCDLEQNDNRVEWSEMVIKEFEKMVRERKKEALDGNKHLFWPLPVYTKKYGCTPPQGYSFDKNGRTIVKRVNDSIDALKPAKNHNEQLLSNNEGSYTPPKY